MKKRTLAFALCLALLICLLSGCSTGGQSAAEESPSASPAASESAAPSEAPAASAEASPEVSAEESVPAESGALDATNAEGALEASQAAITYPLADPDDPIEITQFNPWPSLFDSTGYTEWNDLPILETILEKTGVKYQFMTVSTAAQTEQFNLMMASGDWCDVINAADYYTGGQSQAYAEDIIYDLTDIIPTAAPNYYDLLMNTNQTTIEAVQTGGKYLGMCILYTDPYQDGGTIYRGNWLDKLGVSAAPASFDEFDKVLYGFKDLAGKASIYVSSKGTITELGNIFDCTPFEVSGNATNCAMNLVLSTGKYHSDLVSDQYRKYLEYFIQLYKDGIVANDFYSTNLTDTETEQAAAKGDFGIWTDRANNMHVVREYAKDDTFTMVPGGKLFTDDGKYTYGTITTLADNKGYNVTTQCEYPEKVCSFWNYFFTDEGMVYANYGLEDVSWNYDENGNRAFTELITNNPDGLNPMIVKIVNMFSQTPMLKDNMASIRSDYDAEGLAAIDVWSDTTGQTADHQVPSAAQLNSEETNAIATTQTDIITYATEELLKFMTGTKELSDANWQAYCDQCYSLGLQTVIDTYQNAYDEYLAGTRVVEAKAPGGPPPG